MSLMLTFHLKHPKNCNLVINTENKDPKDIVSEIREKLGI